ncbi:MAG: phosphatidylglycerol lysyltransferase domain-containing protein [Sporomusaceae bacterium]|nr:phosphatidylglycerol lysyltransferase domain-containing protein [Sporomusaceae bacterium]
MVFILFRPIVLEDKELIDSYFQANRYESSVYTFTNFYMWRKPYNIEWAEVEGCLCVRATHHDHTYMLPPIPKATGGSIAAALTVVIDYFKELGQPFLLKGATLDDKAALEAARPNLFTFEADRKNFDYVYLAEDLKWLKGRKYSSKKNHLNYFKRTYSQYQYLPLTPDLLPSCKKTALEWYELRGLDEDSEIDLEKDAVIDMLDHFAAMKLTGGVILIDGKMEAFSIGEPLNSDTAVIHVEKGNPNIRGLYQAINQEFCRNAWEIMTYINREEDMGMEGLRQAKESYHPVKMVEKYDVMITAEG